MIFNPSLSTSLLRVALWCTFLASVSVDLLIICLYGLLAVFILLSDSFGLIIVCLLIIIFVCLLLIVILLLIVLVIILVIFGILGIIMLITDILALVLGSTFGIGASLLTSLPPISCATRFMIVGLCTWAFSLWSGTISIIIRSASPCAVVWLALLITS